MYVVWLTRRLVSVSLNLRHCFCIHQLGHLVALLLVTSCQSQYSWTYLLYLNQGSNMCGINNYATYTDAAPVGSVYKPPTKQPVAPPSVPVVPRTAAPVAKPVTPPTPAPVARVTSVPTRGANPVIYLTRRPSRSRSPSSPRKLEKKSV